MITPEIPSVFPSVYENGKITVLNKKHLTGNYVLNFKIPSRIVPSGVISGSGDIFPCALTDSDGENDSYCFQAELTGNDNEFFEVCTDGKPNYPALSGETPKTLEGDHLHLTLNDNGTLVIASKDSGCVFFEMLTLLSVILPYPESGYFQTFTGIPKRLCRVSSQVHGEFHITSVIPTLNENVKAGFNATTEEKEVFIRVFFGRCEPFIRVSVTFKAPEKGNSLYLRLPSGMYITSYHDGDTEFPVPSKVTFVPSGKVSFEDENGAAFSIECPDGGSVSVENDGNIDLMLYGDGCAEKEGTECSRSFIITPSE